MFYYQQTKTVRFGMTVEKEPQFLVVTRKISRQQNRRGSFRLFVNLKCIIYKYDEYEFGYDLAYIYIYIFLMIFIVFICFIILRVSG